MLNMASVDCETSMLAHAARLHLVQVRVPSSAENPGYLSKDRVASYAATQEIIVPRENIYSRIIDRIPWNPAACLKFVEFGFGTGAFLQRLVSVCRERQQRARVAAFDLSPQMGELAKFALERELTKDADIEISLVTGVNCLDPEFSSPLFDDAEPIDVVAQLQFAHYAPNSHESFLGRKTRQDGTPRLTKPEWLQRLRDWLAPNGILFEFDDFAGASTLEDEIGLKAWDLWVLRQLRDPQVQDRIGQTYPRLVQSIVKRYSKGDSLEEMLSAVERHRTKRRSVCREEVVTLDRYLSWLRETFGSGSTVHLETGLGFSHQRFKLLMTRKTWIESSL